jgi:inward rectifier potassium channel
VADRQIRGHLNGLAARLKASSGRRIVSLNGRSVIAQGANHSFWGDLYYNAMTASWGAFVAASAAVFFLSNLVFAVILWLGAEPVANARGLADLFFFSIETTTTVGYGDMHPQSVFGHSVAAVEGFASLFVTAALTGLVFARLSLPRARLIFAKNPIVMRRNGVPTLVFRVANARGNFISEATAKIWVLMSTVDSEGRRLVGFQPMRLLKSENPAFVLSWTLFHPIDAESPLHGLSEADIREQDMTFVVSVTGLDETSAQTMHGREAFSSQDLRFDHEFVDMISIDDDGVRHVDYGRIHDTRPVASAGA